MKYIPRIEKTQKNKKASVIWDEPIKKCFTLKIKPIIK
jgi:hypothetical protein